MDAIDRQIVEALVADARISLKNLSTRVKLSSPSVSERLRRLEERGVIRAFTVDLDPRALGYQLEAIVRIRALPGKGQIVQEQLRQIPEITECDKVTGEDCFIARLVIRTMEELEHYARICRVSSVMAPFLEGLGPPPTEAPPPAPDVDIPAPGPHPGS